MRRYRLSLTIWVTVLFSSISAQQLEKILFLPDSLAGLRADNFHLTPVTDAGEIWVTGTEGNAIIAFDWHTGVKRQRINLEGGVVRLCYIQPESAVFCASASFDTLYIYDITGYQPLPPIPLPGKVKYLTYNQFRNKLYLSGPEAGGRAIVVNCQLREVTAEIAIDGSGGPSAHQCRFDRIYLFVETADGNKILVIDADTDSVIDVIELGRIEIAEMLINQVANKLYGTSSRSGDVVIVDLWSNQVLRHWVIAHGPGNIVFNPDRNRIYINIKDDSCILVISGETDTVINTIYCPAHPIGLAYDPNQDLLYVTLDDPETPLVAVDCATETVAWSANFPGHTDSLFFNPAINRLYIIRRDRTSAADIIIFNTQTRQVDHQIPLLFQADWAGCVPELNKLYVAGRIAGSGAPMLVPINTSTNTLLNTLPLPDIGFLEYNRLEQKLYVAGESLLAVIDAHADSLIRTLGGIYRSNCKYPLFFNPAGNRLFAVTDSESVKVIHGTTDSVLCVIHAPAVRTFGSNPRQNRIQISSDDSLRIVDGTTGTPLAQLAGNFGDLCCYLPDRDWNLWANGQTLRAIGGTGNTLDTVVTLNHSIDAMLFAPHAGKIYIAASADGMIHVYSGINLTPLNHFPVPDSPAVLKVDTINHLLYCRHADGRLTIIDIRSDRIIATIASPLASWSPVIDQSRSKFYTPDPESLGIAVYRMPSVGLSAENNVRPENQPPGTTIMTREQLERRISSGQLMLADVTGRVRTADRVSDLRRLPAGIYFLKAGTDRQFRAVIVH